MLSMCPWISPLINFWIPEPIFMKLHMHIMVPEPISSAYFINPTVLCLYVYIARVAWNTRATIEELLALFSMRSVYQKKVND
jgi:hypothetical protein